MKVDKKTKNKSNININAKKLNNGFNIKVNNSSFKVSYPLKIWSNFSDIQKNAIIENFTYSRTLPLVVSGKYIQSSLSEPYLKKFIEYGFVKDLPRVEAIEKQQFNYDLNQYKFADNKSNDKRFLEFDKKLDNNAAILSMSFGKDSLLTYGLMKEIGINCHIVMIDDMKEYNNNEYLIKKQISELFSRQEKEDFFILKDNTDNIFRTNELNLTEFDSTNALLIFTLELMPIAYFHRAKYIIFGNEANFDNYYLNSNKEKIYSSFDQSFEYFNKKNKYLCSNKSNNIEAISLVKPLYGIAEIIVLKNRYKHLLQYVASCSSDYLVNEKWCNQCPMCAIAFLYYAAANYDPTQIGLCGDFFSYDRMHFYTLFKNNDELRVYEKPQGVRDEQLLAFLLAYQNGYKGDLIDLFKKKYLKEAQNREVELRKYFFGIHNINAIPKEFQTKVLGIFKEELQKFA